jgi:hypothetical protein
MINNESYQLIEAEGIRQGFPLNSRGLRKFVKRVVKKIIKKLIQEGKI